MDPSQALGFALSALGACICAIGWWIGTTLASLNDKMGKVLVILGDHNVRIGILENSPERLSKYYNQGEYPDA